VAVGDEDGAEAQGFVGGRPISGTVVDCDLAPRERNVAWRLHGHAVPADPAPGLPEGKSDISRVLTVSVGSSLNLLDVRDVTGAARHHRECLMTFR
jgi:hypothetical protein